MRMWMDIGTIALAVEKLQKIRPILQITSITPVVDGVCFETAGGAIYKYNFISDRIFRTEKDDWRTHTDPILVEVKD